MKYFILFFFCQTLLFAGDITNSSKAIQYKLIDKSFTLNCDCGIPAELLPYNGENIPMAKTMPCLSGCNIGTLNS